MSKNVVFPPRNLGISTRRFLKDDPTLAALFCHVEFHYPSLCYDTRQPLSSLAFVVINESRHPSRFCPRAVAREGPERKTTEGRLWLPFGRVVTVGVI